MTFADKVSSLRIILVPAFVSVLIYSKHNETLRYVAVAIFVLAVLTDFFDGLIARIKKEKSELGQIIDPLADKLLLLTAFIAMYLLKFDIPLYAVLIIVSRDAVILLGVLVLHLLKVQIPIAPSWWGKFTTFSQMLTILMVLLMITGSRIVCNIAVIFTIISGCDYFMRGIKAINGNHSSNR